MSLKKFMIRLLDRPGGRFILAAVSTRLARMRGGRDIDVFYEDGLWVHRVGPHYFPDGRRYEYRSSSYAKWSGQAERYLAKARDYWLRFYRPQPGDVVIDVGAGRGEDTMAFSQVVGDTGRVLAIEAHPQSFELLQDFCRRNGLRNVTPLHVAVMDRPGRVRMSQSGQWYDAAITLGDDPSGIEVRGASLDEICQEAGFSGISFVKMNIEGAERHALEGMQSVLKQLKAICVACHDFRADRGDGEEFRTRAFVERVLTEHGFRLASRPEDRRAFVRDHVFGLR